MTSTPNEPLFTYQDLVARFQVSYKTIWRWFHARCRFKPTNGTVRITETEVKAFTQESTTREKKRKHG